MRSAIVQRPIDAAALLEEVARVANGAAVLFLGTVRDVNDGAPVTALDYSAYGAMAERELTDIVSEAAARWLTQDIVVEHRIGGLTLGDISVAIAVAHPHRDEAYAASRYVIEELKKRLPIWKREHYADGRAEWTVNREQRPGEPGMVATSADRPGTRSGSLTASSDGRARAPGSVAPPAGGPARSSGRAAMPASGGDASSGSAATRADSLDTPSASAVVSADSLARSSGKGSEPSDPAVLSTDRGGRRVRRREHADGQ